MKLLKKVYEFLYYVACRRHRPYDDPDQASFDIALGLVITERGTVVPVFDDTPGAAEAAFRNAYETDTGVGGFSVISKTPAMRGAYYRLVKECEFERACTVTKT